MANLPTAEAVRRVVVNGVQMATAAGIDTGIEISESGIVLKNEEEQEREKSAAFRKKLFIGGSIVTAVLLGPKIVSWLRRK